MIRLLSKVKIIDNSGGLIGKCIKIIQPKNQGTPKKLYASIGDIILISILRTSPQSNIKKGDLYKAMIVRTKRVTPLAKSPLYHRTLYKRLDKFTQDFNTISQNPLNIFSNFPVSENTSEDRTVSHISREVRETSFFSSQTHEVYIYFSNYLKKICVAPTLKFLNKHKISEINNNKSQHIPLKCIETAMYRRYRTFRVAQKCPPLWGAPFGGLKGHVERNFEKPSWKDASCTRRESIPEEFFFSFQKYLSRISQLRTQEIIRNNFLHILYFKYLTGDFTESGGDILRIILKLTSASRFNSFKYYFSKAHEMHIKNNTSSRMGSYAQKHEQLKNLNLKNLLNKIATQTQNATRTEGSTTATQERKTYSYEAPLQDFESKNYKTISNLLTLSFYFNIRIANLLRQSRRNLISEEDKALRILEAQPSTSNGHIKQEHSLSPTEGTKQVQMPSYILNTYKKGPFSYSSRLKDLPNLRSFNDNAVVLIKINPKDPYDYLPIGSRIKGPICNSLKKTNLKIYSITRSGS